LETWVKYIAKKLAPKQNFRFIIWPNSINSIVEMPTNGQPTIYIGTKNKNKKILIGEIAHEISEIILGTERLDKKKYYKIILSITKSYELTNKWSYLFALLTGLIYNNETRADQLALKIIKKSGINQNYIFDYLVWLNKQNHNFLVKRMIKKRLKIIKRLLKIN